MADDHPLPPWAHQVGGVDLEVVADRFGTPTYVLDEVGLLGSGAAISRGFGDAEVPYSTSSLLTGAVARSVAGQRYVNAMHFLDHADAESISSDTIQQTRAVVIAWSNIRVTFVGLGKNHAMVAYFGNGTPVRFGSSSCAILLDATSTK